MARTPGVPISLTEKEPARGTPSRVVRKVRPRGASVCRRALPSRPRHGYKKHPQLPSPRPTKSLRGWPGRPLALHYQPPGPPSPTWTNQHRPGGGAAGRGPPARGAIGQPGRHSGGRALPTPPSLPFHPPSPEKRRLGQGGSQRQAGSAGVRSGGHRKKRAGQARAEGSLAGRRRGDKMAALAEGQA